MAAFKKYSIVACLLFGIVTGAQAQSWTSRNSGTTMALRSAVWNGSLAVVVGDSGTILTSPDGIAWISRASGTSSSLQKVIWTGSRFVAKGTGVLTSSPDGLTWTSQATTGPSSNIMVWTGSQFVAVGAGAYTSPDGITWTQRASSLNLRDVAWNGTLLAAVSENAEPLSVFTSRDGITWTARSRSGATSQSMLCVEAVGDNTFLAAGQNGQTWSSSGVTWEEDEKLGSPNPVDISSINHSLGAVFFTGSKITLSPVSDTVVAIFAGFNRHAPDVPLLAETISLGNILVAIGLNGTIITYPRTPATSLPAAPVLSSPLNTSAVSDTLKWASTAPEMHVQLAKDSLFSQVVMEIADLGEETRHVFGPLTHNATYFWRVRGWSTAGLGPWSAIGRFTTLPAVPAAPQLTSPAAGAIAVPVADTLKWQPTLGAARYRVQVSLDSAFGAFVIDDSSGAIARREFTGLTAGTRYFWRVSGSGDSGAGAWSEVRAFTTAVSAPLIGSQPRDTTVVAGAAAAFTVGATGQGLTYQWRKGTANVTAGTGGTAATYLLANVAIADTAANYNVVVTASGSGSASTTSNNARLYVNVAPTIITQPVPVQNIVMGTNITLTVTGGALVQGSSSGSISYQWRKSSATLTNVGNISGTTSASLVITNPVITVDTGHYTVTITRTLNGTTTSVTSGNAYGIVVPPLGILPGSFVSPGIASGAGVLRFGLPEREHVIIRLLDARGRNMVRLLDEMREAGYHTIALPADLRGSSYLVEFRAGTYRRTLMILP